MKLEYLVLSSNPLVIKCFYEEGAGPNKRYGEFYINQNRKDSLDADNPTDKLGVRGELEIVAKDPEYSKDLLHGLAQALQTVEDTCDLGISGTTFCSKHNRYHKN